LKLHAVLHTALRVVAARWRSDGRHDIAPERRIVTQQAAACGFQLGTTWLEQSLDRATDLFAFQNSVAYGFQPNRLLAIKCRLLHLEHIWQ
jgi:hypothetical protein